MRQINYGMYKAFKKRETDFRVLIWKNLQDQFLRNTQVQNSKLCMLLFGFEKFIHQNFIDIYGKRRTHEKMKIVVTFFLFFFFLIFFLFVVNFVIH